ncbi:MAG: molybdate ABC transporter substrate-binding protein [Synergistaceae bacterium]|jgi:molybdate transport system substrate-binding protein|nr:molybdate ABC transporter substrate-binding protein [Synergistaceae bacterium]
MKKFLALFTCLCALSLPALAAEGATTITVFAAASMTESMNQIVELYKKAAPDVTVVCNFDSSGTLKTQIQAGAECDIFISAGQRQMDQLDITADPAVNTEKLDFVLPESRFDIVSNQVVLIVPKGKNTKGIDNFADVVTDKVSLAALGNSDVPVGQYSQEIYTTLGLWDELNGMSKITFASNVKEVLVQVAAGAVDCGVVYGTDAATSDGVEVVAFAPAGSHRPIVYPAAMLRGAQDKASAFVEFLKGEESTNVFKSIGFSIPPR